MKKKIIGAIQMCLMIYMLFFGFLFTYAGAWILLGWPLETWSLVILIILAFASVFGLIQWICTTTTKDDENG